MRTRSTTAGLLDCRVIRLVVLAGCAVGLWCSTAQAQTKKVVGWKLDQIKTGDLTYLPPADSGVAKGTVKIGEIKADATGGTMLLSVQCGHSTRHWPQYKLEWEFNRSVEYLRKGDTFSVRMKFTRIDDLVTTCPATNYTPYCGHSWESDLSVRAVIPQVERGGGNIFDTAKGGEKSRIDIFPSPDNEKLGGYEGPKKSETIIPLIVLDKDYPCSYFAINASARLAKPGALYFFRAVYEGEREPSGSAGGASRPARSEQYVYDGGSFTRHVANGKAEWVESKTDGSAQFRFAETERDNQWIRLFDAGRNMALRLPVAGGMCSWSTDDGKTWNDLYRVDRAK